MIKRTLWLAILALLSLVLLPVSAQGDTASIRVAHFSPDAPDVDVYVNGDVAIEGLAFTEVTGFRDFPAGTYEVAVAPAGTSFDDAVIGPLDLEVEAGTVLTIAAVGSVEDGTLTASIISEDASPIEAGNARITVVHTIENESALDIYGSSVLLVQALRYPEGGGDGAFTRDVPVGRYNFEANIAESDTTIRVANGVEIEEGEYYLIVALGPQSNEGDLLVVEEDGYMIEEDDAMAEDMSDDEDMAEEDDMAETDEEASEEETSEEEDAMAPSEGSAMIRIAHFSPDAPAVDIYVDGAIFVAGVEFPEVTPFIGFIEGDFEIVVAPAGTSLDDAVIGPVTVTLTDDMNTTVAAVGSLEDETLTATIFTEDYSPIPDGSSRLTFVHTIENESALDLYGSTILLIQAVRYPDLDAGRDGAFTRDVPAGRYNFEANISETDTTIRTASGVEFEDGQYYMVVALGPQANEGDLLIVTPEGYENPDDE